jgi:hypothetical protein
LAHIQEEGKELGEQKEMLERNPVEELYCCTHITDLCTTLSLISPILFPPSVCSSYLPFTLIQIIILKKEIKIMM